MMVDKDTEKCGKLLFSDASAPPSAAKLCFWIIFGDFIAAIAYGVAVEAANGNIDAQMDGAPAFLITAAVISVFLFFYIRKNVTAVKSSIKIYERALIISAPRLKTGAKRAHAEDENEERVIYRSEIKDISLKGRRILLTTSDDATYYFPRMKKAERIVAAISN